MLKSLALFTSFFATANATSSATTGAPAIHADSSERSTALANASLQAIEGSWLKVSVSCKARTFNASPIPLEKTVVSAEILNLYQAIV